MCIRDRNLVAEAKATLRGLTRIGIKEFDIRMKDNEIEVYRCLLYTSDAADERSSVDLGGRRIIKKKNMNELEGGQDSIALEWKIVNK